MSNASESRTSFHVVTAGVTAGVLVFMLGLVVLAANRVDFASQYSSAIEVVTPAAAADTGSPLEPGYLSAGPESDAPAA